MGYFDLRPPINSSGSEVCHLEGFDISLQTKIEKDEVVSKLLTCTTAKKKMTVSIACAWQASKERRRAGQRFRVDDCCGWPIGASHDRSAPRVGRWEARGSMLRRTFAVWVPFSSSPSTLS